jgi:hypothetical protein
MKRNDAPHDIYDFAREHGGQSMGHQGDKNRMTILEAFVDTNHLAIVVSDLAQVCYEKAEHVRTNYSDDLNSERLLAKAWDRAGEILEKCVRDLDKKVGILP